MDTQDGSEFGVRHERTSTREPDVAFEWMRHAYTDHEPRLSGDPENFEFTSSSISVGPIEFTEMRHSMGFLGPSRPAEKVIVMAPRAGTRMRIACEGQDIVEPLMLAPIWAPFIGQWHDMDLQTVNLDLTRVADYAEYVSGLPSGSLAFSRLCPLSPALAGYWRRTVAYVHRDVLSDPWASTQPIVLEQAFETLAGALLAVFPNSAQAAADDPEGTVRTGRIPAVRSREVVDYLRSHADRPVGIADVAAAGDAPFRDVVDGLRRHDGTHPARELWRGRLRGAFNSLLDADPDVDTVTAIAATWGFTRSSSFATAYRHAFGETPEQTLHR